MGLKTDLWIRLNGSPGARLSPYGDSPTALSRHHWRLACVEASSFHATALSRLWRVCRQAMCGRISGTCSFDFNDAGISYRDRFHFVSLFLHDYPICCAGIIVIREPVDIFASNQNAIARHTAHISFQLRLFLFMTRLRVLVRILSIKYFDSYLVICRASGSGCLFSTGKIADGLGI
jgi:hypothetical protein